jgi:hypothetical protein
MEATALGDVRVAMFILLQERMGKDPARTLAEGVIAANKRAAQPAPAPRTPSASPRAHRPSDDPELRTMQRVESRLRGELQQEHAAVHAAVAADEAPAVVEQTICESRQDDIANQPDPPVEPGDGTKRGGSLHSSSTPTVGEHQRHALEALARLKTTAPDEQPTPRARAP